MAKYSQSLEDDYIVDFFKGFVGCLCSVGENDGITFSNALRLIELGWEAYVFEPASICGELFKRHKNNPKVHVFHYGLSDKTQQVRFYESYSHIKGGTDRALVSTTVIAEKEKWENNGVEYSFSLKTFVAYNDFWRINGKPEFDFISIDCEGMDLVILKQIDLTHTQLLCIEWNSLPEVKKEILSYTSQFNMNKIIYQSAENLLITR